MGVRGARAVVVVVAVVVMVSAVPVSMVMLAPMMVIVIVAMFMTVDACITRSASAYRTHVVVLLSRPRVP